MDKPEINLANVVWKGKGKQFTGILGSGYEFDLGSPAGTEAGSPMEFLLAGVAGCTAVDVVGMLEKMRQPVRGLRVEVAGERADEYPKVYTVVEIVYVVEGEDVDAFSVEKAIRLSMKKYCSASAIFKEAGVEITTDYRIEPVEALSVTSGSG
ncbi:MAG TPA: OsmC family protein [Candidatus Sulfomarinibacteraceae bacterium]|nr:OsmC family protein [Candidatus Sulfomarinibacteraceae bacterium]